MSRSSKKGPYIDNRLIRKIELARASKSRADIKTWARAAVITPDMVGANVAVHNGRDHVPFVIGEPMIGQRLGEFAPTRKFTGHSKKGKIAKATGKTGGGQ